MIVCQYNMDRLGDINIVQHCWEVLKECCEKNDWDEEVICLPDGFTIAEFYAAEDICTLRHWRNMIDMMIKDLEKREDQRSSR